jgi:hypothetical protein
MTLGPSVTQCELKYIVGKSSRSNKFTLFISRVHIPDETPNLVDESGESTAH